MRRLDARSSTAWHTMLPLKASVGRSGPEHDRHVQLLRVAEVAAWCKQRGRIIPDDDMVRPRVNRVMRARASPMGDQISRSPACSAPLLTELFEPSLRQVLRPHTGLNRDSCLELQKERLRDRGYLRRIG
jgi:hypothetical protein